MHETTEKIKNIIGGGNDIIDLIDKIDKKITEI
jgi:hypothetical protein